MEEMRPELEKLQRQYADNKEMYNRKMMALYKRNGYSMWGSCLPTILTLVIFIVAINGFTDYSKFQNKTYFYNMSNSYNNVVYAGFELDAEDRYIYRDKNGKIIVKYENIKADANAFNEVITQNDNNEQITINYSEELDTNKSSVEQEYYNVKVWTEGGYAIYNQTYIVNTVENKTTWLKETYSITAEMLYKTTLFSEENNNLTIKVNGEVKTFAQAVSILEGETEDEKAEKFILDIRQSKSAETYRKEQQSFFWVKNIWATDSPSSHPIERSWSNFKNTHGYNGANIGDTGYKNLIAKLDYEKNAPNGYFILVALTALTSLFMQLVMSKSQKAQMELQTVDGQGAQTQKVMQWVMPIMMAVFAFMYTAAFSIYIIISSVVSIATTYLINFIVDIQIKKENKNKKVDQKIRGRVYVKKEQEKKPEPKKEKKNKDDKFAHEQGGDFLTGKVKIKRK